MFHQPVLKKITSADLNSLPQKECQILVRNWIFDDPFHKKELLLDLTIIGHLGARICKSFDEMRLSRSLRSLRLLRPLRLLRLQRF